MVVYFFIFYFLFFIFYFSILFYFLGGGGGGTYFIWTFPLLTIVNFNILHWIAAIVNNATLYGRVLWTVGRKCPLAPLDKIP